MTDYQDPFASPTAPAVQRPFPDPRPPAKRTMLLTMSGVLFTLLLAAAIAVPAPYAIVSPGPTFDLVDDSDGADLVTVSGVPSYEPDGELRITTVQLSNASTTNFTMRYAIESWFRADRTVGPVEYYWPDEDDPLVPDPRLEWISSQERAAVSALDQLEIAVPAVLTVVDIEDTSFARGELEIGDIIVAANGDGIETLTDLSDVLDATTPGDVVTIGVDRDGDAVDVTFATLDDGSGSAIMGIWIDPEFDLPVDVDVRIEDVGGPSAGMMFSLAILSLMTPVDEIDGARVAGTGTVSIDGEVGPIGGVALKMYGAVNDGAEYFIAPEANCAGIVGHIPEGLSVVTVGTLAEAYDALLAISEDRGDELTACQAE